ncbi:MAG: hypothetical protein M1837_005986 [Sclerophora amabilis]|nr:MAG: hypothetical protein M1837_005986 [Sclerophora amabilis]
MHKTRISKRPAADQADEGQNHSISPRASKRTRPTPVTHHGPPSTVQSRRISSRLSENRLNEASKTADGLTSEEKPGRNSKNQNTKSNLSNGQFSKEHAKGARRGGKSNKVTSARARQPAPPLTTAPRKARTVSKRNTVATQTATSTKTKARPKKTTRTIAQSPGPGHDLSSPKEEVKSARAATSRSRPPQEIGQASQRRQRAKPELVETVSLQSSAQPVTRDRKSTFAVEIKGKSPPEDLPAAVDVAGEEKHYWLMKAEPETRLEKGVNVAFSIDDLKAAQEPEAWEGVRNYGARNRMREMRNGDLAFFYHSNCKSPGIAGILEIVREASDDLTALDPNHPYYHEKSTAENPKWSLVHVVFRTKFDEPVSLAELRGFGRAGGVLENMELLKQSRLSVSKVSKKEWDFILDYLGSNDRRVAGK